jgi:pyroglutamyl-peptidase
MADLGHRGAAQPHRSRPGGLIRLLLTGFVPFGGDRCNPAERVINALAENPAPGVALATAVLPVSFAAAPGALRAAVIRHRPDVLLAMGQAGGHAAIAVERIAVNLDDATMADNDGVSRAAMAAVLGAPASYRASIPVEAVAAAIGAADVAVKISDGAGNFVCNHLFYTAAHFAATECGWPLRVGLLHLPFLPEQVAAAHAGAPSMPLATMLRGLRAAIVVFSQL